MKTKHLIVLLLALVLLNACGTGRNQRALLQKARASLAESPDMALLYLDSIYSPESQLGKADYMDYVLMHAEAAWNSDADVKADTAIFKAARYYEKKGDEVRQSKAELYSGCVWNERDDSKAAMQAYSRSYDLAGGANDSALMAMALFYIGNMHYKANNSEEALDHYKQAYRLYENNCHKQVQILDAIGKTFFVSEDLDSSIVYFQRGIVQAQECNDTIELTKIYFNKSVAYRALGNIQYSAECLGKSIRMGFGNKDQSLLHLNLSYLHQNLGQADSTSYYADLLENDLKTVDDGALKVSILTFLSDYEYSLGKKDLACQYKDSIISLSDSIYKVKLQQSVYEVQKKYDYEKLENMMARKVIRRQRVAVFFAIAFALAALGILLLILRNKRINETKKQIEAELQRLKEETLRKEKENLQKEETKTNESASDVQLQWRLDLILSMAKKKENIKSYKDGWEEMCYAVFNRFTQPFEAVVAAMEESYPNLYATILQKYPGLTETEGKVCLLSCADFSNSAMADLLGISIHTVNKCRSSIRGKMKLDSGGLKKQLQKTFEGK